MHDVSSKSADFFDRETRIVNRLTESINKSISSNVPSQDQQLVQYYLWKQVGKLASSRADDLKAKFIEELDGVMLHEPGFNGPIAAGEYATLELQVRKGGKSLDVRLLNNVLRKKGLTESQVNDIITEASVDRAPSRIFTVKPKV